jgi:hypothetical protein
MAINRVKAKSEQQRWILKIVELRSRGGRKKIDINITTRVKIVVLKIPNLPSANVSWKPIQDRSLRFVAKPVAAMTKSNIKPYPLSVSITIWNQIMQGSPLAIAANILSASTWFVDGRYN